MAPETLARGRTTRREDPPPSNAHLRAFVHRALAAKRTTVALFAVWILSRLVVVIALRRAPLADDALDYHRMAVSLLRGESFEPDWPPGLPVYLWGWYRLFGPHEWVGRIALWVLSGIFPFLLVELLGALAGTVAGNLALLFLIFAPSSLYLAATPLTQLPAALLLLALALVMVGLLARPTVWRSAVIGLLLGSAILVRPSNLLLAAAVPCYLAWRTRRLSTLLVPGLIAALLIVAWTAKAREITGRFVFINNANSQNMFYGNNPDTPLYRTWWFGSHKRGEPGVPERYLQQYSRIAQLSPAERDREFGRAAVAHIKARPDLFVVRSLSRVRTFFAFDTFTATQLMKRARLKLFGLFVLALDGLLYLLVIGLALVWLCADGARPEAERGAVNVALGVGLLYSLPYFLSFSHPTYHFPIVPLLAVPAALIGARWLEGDPLLPTSRRRRRVLAASWAVLALIQVEWIANMSSRL